MDELTSLAKVAPYLTHPLVLVGFVLLLFFAIHRALIKSGIIPPLSKQAGGKIIQELLRYGFVIAVLVIVLGFALEFLKVQKGPRVDVAGVVKTLVESHHKQLTAKDEQIKALTAAVNDLAAQRSRPDAPPGIEEALKQLSQGKPEAAENIFSGILARKTLEGEEANTEAATAARHIGALAFLHDTQKALESYRQAVELDPDNPEGWNPLGHLLHRVGDLPGAEAAYRKVLSLSESASDQVEIAAAYGNLGNVYLTRGELDRAEAMYKKSLAINEALGRKHGMAKSYSSMGNLYYTRDELDRAEEMYKKSLAINEALGRRESMANAYSNLGNVYHIRGELDQAEAMYEKALAINEALGRKEGMAVTYGNQGNVYRTRGELDQAEAMYEKALAINEALGRKEGMANNYGNLGNVYHIRGELDRAEAMYEKSLAINEALGRKEGMANNYGNLGNVYRTRGELDRAEAMYKKSLAINEALGRKYGMAKSYGNLGNVYRTAASWITPRRCMRRRWRSTRR